MKGKKGTKRADGGRTDLKAGGNPDVLKEAAERKKGGRVKKAVAADMGAKAKKKADRPGRKAGGRIGADSAPLSSANRTSSAESTPKTQEGGASD